MPYNSMMPNELNKFQNSNYNQAQRNRDRQQLMKRAMVRFNLIFNNKKKLN